MYYTIKAANNKGADQTAQLRRLICTFVVRIWHKQVFSVELYQGGHWSGKSQGNLIFLQGQGKVGILQIGQGNFKYQESKGKSQ